MGLRVLVCLMVVACKKSEPPGPALVTRIPHVDALEALAAPPSDSLPPPVVVLVDAKGTLAIAVGPSKWSGLASYAPPRSPRIVDTALLDRFVLELAAFGNRVRDKFGSLDRIAREMAEEEKNPRPPEDEPPPPEPPEPDDDAATDPAAIEEPVAPPKPRAPPTHRGRYSDFSAGFTYGVGPGPPGSPIGSSTLKFPPPRPARFASAIGEPLPTVLPAQAVIAVDPTAKAHALVTAVEHTEGSILVEAAGEVRVLRVQFVGDYETHEVPRAVPFIDVRVTADGIEIEGVPSPPARLDWDLAAVGKAVAALVALPHFKAAHVDVIVSEGVTAQQLVDVIAAVDRVGVRAIGIGTRKDNSDPRWKMRGAWMRTFRVDVEAESEEVRTLLREKVRDLKACYETALEKNPAIEGTGAIEVSVDKKGKVTATSTGIDPVVGDCMVSTITRLELPKRAATASVRIKMHPYPTP